MSTKEESHKKAKLPQGGSTEKPDVNQPQAWFKPPYSNILGRAQTFSQAPIYIHQIMSHIHF